MNLDPETQDGTKLEFHSTLTTFLPCAVGFVIFISTARFFLVYEKFNVPIFSYLEFSDLIIGIVNDLYGLTYFLIISLFLFSIRGLLQKISAKIGAIVGAAVFFVIVGSVGFLYWSKQVTNFNTHLLVSLLIYFGLCMGALLIKCLQRSTQKHIQFLKHIDNKLLLFSMIVIFAFLFCKSLSSFVVYQIKHGGTIGTVINIKDRTPLISNASDYYIGNTTKYVFIYDTLTKRCTSYPMGNVTSITHAELPK